MSQAYRLTPWKSVARPHEDVVEGDLDLGTYAVNLAAVFREQPGVPPVYARPDRFFATTYFTDGIRSLLFDVERVLAGGQGNRVVQLRTPFGGGKTHSLVALLHLARHPEAAHGVPELDGIPNPGPVRAAVLSGEELDPLSVRKHDGFETRTLWGELAAQLGCYELMAEHDEKRSAPGGDLLRQVLGEGPVLLLLDEVLVYVEKGMAVRHEDSTLGRQAMLFLQALTEVVNNRPSAAMVYSLQASISEAVGAEGLLSDLEHLVSRVDAKREPVSGDEVMRVVQRRLFAELGPETLRREVAAAYSDLVRRQLQAQALTDDARREAEAEARRLEERVQLSYPFHPALLDLMHHRWGSLPSYQRTRGALQFLACVVNDLWRRGGDSALIGPGEVNLSDEAVRGAFFSQVGERERYSAVLDGDIVGAGSGAAVVDRRIGQDSPALEQLRAGTRIATAVMLFSFGSPEGEEKGVLEGDLVTAVLVPGLDRNVIVAALHDLREEELYLHYSGRRYRFEPVANLTKLIRDEATKFSGDEVLAEVRKRLERDLGGERGAVVWPESPDGIRDRVPLFQVAYLHPDWTPETMPVSKLVEEAGGSKRAYRNGLGFALPDGARFDRARDAARTGLAVASLLSRRGQLGLVEEQKEELEEKLRDARRNLGAHLATAYARAALPVAAGAGAEPFAIETIDLGTLPGAGLSIHRRVLEAFSHHVFDRVTVDKLVSLVGLGSTREYMACNELTDSFYSFFEFTKLSSREPIAAAIAEGVEQGRLAYSVGFFVDAGEPRLHNPDLLRRSGIVRADEVDLGPDAAILTPALASKLSPEPGPDLAPGPEPEPLPPRPLPPVPPSPDETPRNVALRVRLDHTGLFGLQRALAWLRDHSTQLDVEVTVRAAAKDGYEPVRFQNGVVEPLTEGGAEDMQVNLT